MNEPPYIKLLAIKCWIFCSNLYGIFNIDQPAIKVIIFCHINQLISNSFIWVLILENFHALFCTIFPLCDKGTQYLHTMLVCSVCPAWWWNGYKIMAEVDKYVNVLPMINTITFSRGKSLNKSKTWTVGIWIPLVKKLYIKYVFQGKVSGIKLPANNHEK